MLGTSPHAIIGHESGGIESQPPASRNAGCHELIVTAAKMGYEASHTIVPHPESLIPNKCLTDHDLARRRDSSFTLAMKTQASALAIEASKSLASLRLRPNQAKVRSTTQRRGSALKVPTL